MRNMLHFAVAQYDAHNTAHHPAYYPNAQLIIPPFDIPKKLKIPNTISYFVEKKLKSFIKYGII